MNERVVIAPSTEWIHAKLSCSYCNLRWIEIVRIDCDFNERCPSCGYYADGADASAYVRQIKLLKIFKGRFVP